MMAAMQRLKSMFQRKRTEEPITHVSQIKPNTIVQYEGGGYDGCFWEFNYAYFDSDRQFHDIYSSGYKGCDSVEKLQEALEKANQRYGRPSRLDFYHLDDSEEVERFGRETPISHLLHAAKWFQENEIPVKLTVKCDLCERIVPVVQCEGEGVHGVGGIATQYNDIVCAECEDEGTCRYCGSFVGKECIEPATGYCTGKNDGGWIGCHEQHGDE